MFYDGARTFRAGTAPVPPPAADEVLLRVRRVGICGTDLHIFQGHLDHRVPKGGVIGHETFAEVLEARRGSAFAAGDRVVVEPVEFCGTCRACKMGASYICYGLKVLGVDKAGGMQQYWAVRENRLIRVPATLSDEHAALMEPLAIAVHDVRRAEVKPGDAVLVFGGGPIGTLIAMVSRHRGARVAVAEVNPFRVEMLRGLGFEVIGPDRDPVRFAEEWTGGDGVDVAFEVTGHPAAVRAVTDVVRVWGTVSIVAIHAEPMPVNLYQMFARELSLHGSRLYTRGDWEDAIRLGAAGAVTLAPLVSRTLPLEGLAEGMQLALGGGNVMKVLIDPSA
jgi:2-desacetyl-2-hydroxyethyl bacteriochlorophyllide A dehydrogenase